MSTRQEITRLDTRLSTGCSQDEKESYLRQVAQLQRENEQLRKSNEYQRRRLKVLEFREKLDPIPNKLFSPTDKLLAAVLEEQIHTKKEENAQGFYLIRIGKKPYKSNLMGMTGLSHKTIAETIMIFHNSGLIERKSKPGTPEQNYEDAELLIRFTEKWTPETMQRLEERHISYARVAVCPHCTSENIAVRQYICIDCGGTFPKPLYVEKGNEEDEEQPVQALEPQNRGKDISPTDQADPEPVSPALARAADPLEWSEFDHPYVDGGQAAHDGSIDPELQVIQRARFHLPDWLDPTTIQWQRQVEENGLSEMIKRRVQWYKEQGKTPEPVAARVALVSIPPPPADCPYCGNTVFNLSEGIYYCTDIGCGYSTDGTC